MKDETKSSFKVQIFFSKPVTLNNLLLNLLSAFSFFLVVENMLQPKKWQADRQSGTVETIATII